MPSRWRANDGPAATSEKTSWSSGTSDMASRGTLQVARRRDRLTVALGLVWLLDAALQYQPFMFTTAFPRRVIRPTADGNPGWVATPVHWAAGLMAHHIVPLNAVFATVQLLIALGLCWRRSRRLALAGSVLWAGLVWWLGEGLGGILTGPVSPLAGLPGAVILYAVISVLLWPRRSAPPSAGHSISVACSSPLRRGALLLWLGLWWWFAVEVLLPANRAPGAIHDLIAGMSDGEPAWIAHVNTWAARLLLGHDVEASIALAVCFVVIGVSVLATAALARAGVVFAVLVSLLMWVIAQDFGTIATGQATDPNTGLVLALLAACYWPPPVNLRRRGHCQGFGVD